jgi:Tfp pilus assembly protein PilF
MSPAKVRKRCNMLTTRNLFQNRTATVREWACLDFPLALGTALKSPSRQMLSAQHAGTWNPLHSSGRTPTSRMVLSVALLALVLPAGCQTLPKHQQDKEQAAQRWSEVRGRFKYQLARQKYEGGLFGEAVSIATEAIALDPKEPGAYVVHARANLELGKPSSAESTIRAARNVGLNTPDLIYTEGVVREQRGDMEGALQAYRAARVADIRNVDYLVAEAESLVALGRADEAQALLDDNRSRYDDDATVAALAAHVAARRGDMDGAIARYRQAKIDHRDSRVIPRELGLLLVEQRRFDEAIATLRPLLTGKAGDEAERIVRHALATSYLHSGAPEAAKDVLIDYARTQQDDALGQLLLAKASLATGDLMTAMRAVDLAQQQEPNRTELWLVRAAVQWRRGDHEAAMASLYDLLANHPDDVEAMCLLAEILKDRRQKEGARGYFERALKVEPKSTWARAGLKSLDNAPEPRPRTEGAKLTAAE